MASTSMSGSVEQCKCHHCQHVFSEVFIKYHCKVCGLVTCDNCSSKVEYGNTIKRLCTDCIRSYEGHQMEVLRKRLPDELNENVSDFKCIQFLRARNMNVDKAQEMIQNWWTWWNTPLPGDELCPYNILTRRDDPLEPVYSKLVPHTFHGEDKRGRPVFYERTGLISKNFSELKKDIPTEDILVSRHVRVMELEMIRLVHQSHKHHKFVSKINIVFDLAEMDVTPDMMGIQFLRKMLHIDQNYYPETLQKMFIINAPWFFTAIWALISPWMDPLIAQKVIILGADFLPVLRRFINDDNIPDYLGGSCTGLSWHYPYEESEGISPDQLIDAVNRRGDSKYGSWESYIGVEV